MQVTEFTEEMQRDVFNIVASVLNLGNTGFSEVDGKAKIIKSEGVEATSKVSLIDLTALIVPNFYNKNYESVPIYIQKFVHIPTMSFMSFIF